MEGCSKVSVICTLCQKKIIERKRKEKGSKEKKREKEKKRKSPTPKTKTNYPSNGIRRAGDQGWGCGREET